MTQALEKDSPLDLDRTSDRWIDLGTTHVLRLSPASRASAVYPRTDATTSVAHMNRIASSSEWTRIWLFVVPFVLLVGLLCFDSFGPGVPTVLLAIGLAFAVCLLLTSHAFPFLVPLKAWPDESAGRAIGTHSAQELARQATRGERIALGEDGWPVTPYLQEDVFARARRIFGARHDRLTPAYSRDMLDAPLDGQRWRLVDGDLIHDCGEAASSHRIYRGGFGQRDADALNTILYRTSQTTYWARIGWIGLLVDAALVIAVTGNPQWGFGPLAGAAYLISSLTPTVMRRIVLGRTLRSAAADRRAILSEHEPEIISAEDLRRMTYRLAATTPRPLPDGSPRPSYGIPGTPEDQESARRQWDRTS